MIRTSAQHLQVNQQVQLQGPQARDKEQLRPGQLRAKTTAIDEAPGYATYGVPRLPRHPLTGTILFSRRENKRV